MSDVFAFIFPVFVFIVLFEAWRTKQKGLTAFYIPDSITNLNNGILFRVLGRFVIINFYSIIFDRFAITTWSSTSVPMWIAAILFFEFCHYWWHRMSHNVNVLWAAHEVHHSSEYLNLSTALRVPFTGFLFQWLFYVPMALAGVPPIMYNIISFSSFIYGSWTHTEAIGRLGILDRLIITPSNHRVHHGQNDYCINKNYGELLTIWDRVFGTYEPERDGEKIYFGIRHAIHSFNPIWINLHYYEYLWNKSIATNGWVNKLKLWLDTPDGTVDKSTSHFDSKSFKKFKANSPTQIHWYALTQFLIISPFVGHFLIIFNDLHLLLAIIYAASITISTLILGAILDGKAWARRFDLMRIFILPFLFYSAPFGYVTPLAGTIILSICSLLSAVWLTKLDQAAFNN